MDTSGSMNDEVGAATGEQDGFSIMDVTKHGILTCLCGLRPEDKAAIVAFSTDARVIMPLRKMDVCTYIIYTTGIKMFSCFHGTVLVVYKL